MTDTLIVIGAGSNPDPYLQEAYERAILIEPSPRLAESLRQKTADNTAVRVEECAVVTNTALNQLNEFNLPEVASVRNATGLKHLLAGLRFRTSHPIATLLAAELCKRFELSEDGRHKLIVQANGEEVNIVLSLIESGDLARFQHVTLGARRTAYYEGEETIDAISGPLQELGFEARQEKSSGPDWPVWEFEVNPLHRVVETLKSELESQRAENAELHEKHNFSQRFQEYNRELQEQLKELESELDSAKGQLSKLVAEKEADQNQWDQERAALIEQREKLRQELQQHKQQVASMERTNSMQAKLLTKVETDSQDLRSRYADLQKRERELADLIKELHGKLELASGFFRQIQNEHPELIEQY